MGPLRNGKRKGGGEQKGQRREEKADKELRTSCQRLSAKSNGISSIVPVRYPLPAPGPGVSVLADHNVVSMNKPRNPVKSE